MQVYNGAVTQAEAGILSGNASLLFPDHKDVSTGALEFSRGVRLSEGLRQGRSYVVHAVAEDANSPDPNRRSRFCTSAPDSITPGGVFYSVLAILRNFDTKLCVSFTMNITVHLDLSEKVQFVIQSISYAHVKVELSV